MEQSFKAAVGNEAAQQLLFTSDWDQTINCDAGPNFALLEFLSDAKRAGHRVIITSSMAMDKIESALKIFLMSARRRGYDVLDMDDFELICKSDLKELHLKSDYSFDDECIAKQLYSNYIDAGIEVTVRNDFSMFPWTFEILRERCNLPRDKKGSGPSAETRAPEAFK